MDIEQINDILLNQHNFLPIYSYDYDRLSLKMKEIFLKKFNKIAIVINYDDNFQIFFARIKSITILTSFNEIEYTLNISQDNYINFILNNLGFNQLEICGKNYYKIDNHLKVKKNRKDFKNAKSLKIFINEYN